MSETNDPPRERAPFKILALDGGGAKGVYTLGFLKQLEAAVGRPLGGFFDAIYGTSTGAIIAALLGLGRTSEEVLALYLKHVPNILRVPYKIPWPLSAWLRSRALARVGDELFEGKKFDAFQTFVAIVATHWNLDRPLIFKSGVEAAHGMRETFVPGGGCTISEAVQASCSATPFFRSKRLDLETDGPTPCRDGGFAANNPSLFALTDALGPFGRAPQEIRLLSLGVGHYPEPKRGWFARKFMQLPTPHLLQKTLNVNANTTEQLVNLLCPDVPRLRVSERFVEPELATDFLEARRTKLDLLIQRGRQSYAHHETEVKNLLNIHVTP